MSLAWLADLAHRLTSGAGYDTPEWRARFAEHDAWMARFRDESLAFEAELADIRRCRG